MKELHDELENILLAFGNGHYVHQTFALDVFFAYRLLLFRNPEATSFEELRARTAEFPVPQDLTRGFMSSTEFRDNHLGRSQRPDGRVVVVREGDLRIAVHLDDLAISWAIINGSYEPETQWLVRSLVKPGFTCVDLGANVGFFTAKMAEASGAQGRVISYEPFPTVFHLLSITVEESGLGDRVSLRRKACSDQPSSAKLCFAAQSNNYGGQFVVEDGQDVGAGLSTVDIEVTSVDADLADVPKVDFIKMDVEGVEAKALRGMKGRLLADRPVLVMEVNPDGLAVQQSSPAEVLGLMEEYGFRSFLVGALHGGQAVEVRSRNTASFPPGSFENVVCIPSESVGEVLALLGRSEEDVVFAPELQTAEPDTQVAVSEAQGTDGQTQESGADDSAPVEPVVADQ